MDDSEGEASRARNAVAAVLEPASRREKIPYRSARNRATEIQRVPARRSTITEPLLLSGVRPQTRILLPSRKATNGNRKAWSEYFGCPPAVKNPD